MSDNGINYEEPIFTISTAAKILEISIPTLRMYEHESLFIPFKKITHQRLYSEADIDRIACIRRSINELKISINGIKAIYSLIPCWDIFKCNPDDRMKCSAFNGIHQPCWSYKPVNRICERQDCRDCKVYKNYSDCMKIKELLKSRPK